MKGAKLNILKMFSLWALRNLAALLLAIVWAGKGLEDDTPNMLERFPGNIKITTATITTTKTSLHFSSKFFSRDFLFPVLFSGICGCLRTSQNYFCVWCWWVGPLCHSGFNCWLPSSLTFCSLEFSSHISSSEVFEEKVRHAFFFRFAAVFHGCLGCSIHRQTSMNSNLGSMNILC